jgi:predicted DNA-binding protein
MTLANLKKREYLNHQFNFRISLNTKERLESLSDEYDLNPSYIVRTALNNFLNTELDE